MVNSWRDFNIYLIIPEKLKRENNGNIIFTEIMADTFQVWRKTYHLWLKIKKNNK